MRLALQQAQNRALYAFGIYSAIGEKLIDLALGDKAIRKAKDGQAGILAAERDKLRDAFAGAAGAYAVFYGYHNPRVCGLANSFFIKGLHPTHIHHAY